MKKIILPGLLAALILLSCKHQVLYPGNTGNNNGNSNNNDTSGNSGNSVVCFEGEILPIFQSSCAKAGCHDANTREEGYVFDSYANIVRKGIVAGKPDKSEVYKILAKGEMPPEGYPRLSVDQLALIKQWITEGANNTTNCTDCDTAVYTYSGAVSKILSTNCVGCHSTVLPSAGVDLSIYDGALAVALNGTLMAAVTHAPNYSPMPQGGQKLSDCKIRQIQKWIDAGAPNN